MDCPLCEREDLVFEDDCYYCPDCDEYFDEDGCTMRLDIHEAARIWLSSGRDEDNMFGYTEDELEDALN